jgi:YfiH family protein
MDGTEGVIRASVLAPLGKRAGFTTRALGEAWTAPPGVKVFGIRQVHSSRVIRVTQQSDPETVRRTEADGIVTVGRDVALTIRVADCVPVLLSTPDGGSAAALHAGWRGIASGILGRGVETICEEAGCAPSDLLGAAGPAIGPCCYEVDLATGRRIASPAAGGVLSKPYGDGKVKADLWRAVLEQLAAAGMRPGNTEAIRRCTRCNPDLFHSYRRDGPRAGRQMGFIVTID